MTIEEKERAFIHRDRQPSSWCIISWQEGRARERVKRRMEERAHTTTYYLLSNIAQQHHIIIEFVPRGSIFRYLYPRSTQQIIIMPNNGYFWCLIDVWYCISCIYRTIRTYSVDGKNNDPARHGWGMKTVPTAATVPTNNNNSHDHGGMNHVMTTQTKL